MNFSLLHLRRFPAPGKGNVTTEGYECTGGFSSVLVIDLQRVFACVEVHTGEEGSFNMDYISQVASASSSFSPRVVLPMSASSEWRQDC